MWRPPPNLHRWSACRPTGIQQSVDAIQCIRVWKPSKLWLLRVFGCSIIGRHHTRTARCDNFLGNKHQAKIQQAYAGMSIMDRWPRFSAHAEKWLHSPCAASLSCSLLLSRVERNWATVLGGHRADRWPSLKITGRPCRAHAAQSRVTDADNAALQLINAHPRVTVTNRTANARKLNSDLNL